MIAFLIVLGILLIVGGGLNLGSWGLNPLGYMLIVFGIGAICFSGIGVVNEQGDKTYMSYTVVEVVNGDIIVKSDSGEIKKLETSDYETDMDNLALAGDKIEVIDEKLSDDVSLFRMFEGEYVLITRSSFLGNL